MFLGIDIRGDVTVRIIIMKRSGRDDPDYILKWSKRPKEWPAEFPVWAVVEGADAANAPCGLIAGAHTVDSVKCLARGRAWRSLESVSGRLGDLILDGLAARGRWNRYRSRSQTGQRRAPFKNCLRSDFFGFMGIPSIIAASNLRREIPIFPLFGSIVPAS